MEVAGFGEHRGERLRQPTLPRQHRQVSRFGIRVESHALAPQDAPQGRIEQPLGILAHAAHLDGACPRAELAVGGELLAVVGQPVGEPLLLARGHLDATAEGRIGRWREQVDPRTSRPGRDAGDEATCLEDQASGGRAVGPIELVLRPPRRSRRTGERAPQETDVPDPGDAGFPQRCRDAPEHHGGIVCPAASPVGVPCGEHLEHAAAQAEYRPKAMRRREPPERGRNCEQLLVARRYERLPRSVAEEVRAGPQVPHDDARAHPPLLRLSGEVDQGLGLDTRPEESSDERDSDSQVAETRPVGPQTHATGMRQPMYTDDHVPGRFRSGPRAGRSKKRRSAPRRGPAGGVPNSGVVRPDHGCPGAQKTAPRPHLPASRYPAWTQRSYPQPSTAYSQD